MVGGGLGSESRGHPLLGEVPIGDGDNATTDDVRAAVEWYFAASAEHERLSRLIDDSKRSHCIHRLYSEAFWLDNKARAAASDAERMALNKRRSAVSAALGSAVRMHKVEMQYEYEAARMVANCMASVDQFILSVPAEVLSDDGWGLL